MAVYKYFWLSKMLTSFCLMLLYGAAFAVPSGNQYMDNVLHTTLQNVLRTEKLDPTHLSDYTFDYSDKTIFGKVHGKAEYSEGSLSGLSQVARVSDCQGPTNVSTTTTITCTVFFSALSTSYKGKVKYGVLPKVTIDAKGNTTAVIRAVIAKGFSEQRAKVQYLTLNSMRPLDTHFTGLGPLNKHMKVLENNYKSQVSSEVSSVLVNRFQYALNIAVGQVPMPLR